MKSPLSLIITFLFIQSLFAACGELSKQTFQAYFKGSDTYFWNNCSKDGQAYFSQDINVSSNWISSELEKCYSYTSSDVRKKCESDNNLANLSSIIQAAYKCFVDYNLSSQSYCSAGNTCDTQSNECDYQNNKQGSSSKILVFNTLTNSDFKEYTFDIALGLESTECPFINTNCGNLIGMWQKICVKAYKQQCLEDYLKKSFSSDLSVIAYQCLQKTVTSSLLSQFSILAIIAFFTL